MATAKMYGTNRATDDGDKSYAVIKVQFHKPLQEDRGLDGGIVKIFPEDIGLVVVRSVIFIPVATNTGTRANSFGLEELLW